MKSKCEFEIRKQQKSNKKRQENDWMLLSVEIGC